MKRCIVAINGYSFYNCPLLLFFLSLDNENKPMKKNSHLVYSTETGRIKPDNHKQSTANTGGDGIVRIHRETKGRKGNGVSLIKGLSLDDKDIKALTKTLKQKMGVGGSVKDGSIEIQSDQREKLKTLLEAMGHTVKIAGS